MDILQYFYLAIYLAALVALFVYGMNCYFLLIYYRLNYPKALKTHEVVKKKFYQQVPSRDWPRVTIQLPIYNERYVVKRLIESVSRIDYPRHLIEIQVLDDSIDDTGSIAKSVVESISARGFNIVYIHRKNRTGFKAGALKEGLKSASGELIAIFDATQKLVCFKRAGGTLTATIRC